MKTMLPILLAMVCVAAQDAAKSVHDLTLQTSGKWQNPVLVNDVGSVAKLKAHPVLKVDLSVGPEDQDAWFMAKLAIQSDSVARAESPQWLLDRAPGQAGIDKTTLSWDVGEIVAKMPADPKWFKIELVTQGGRARPLHIDNIRCEGGADAATEKLKPNVPVPTLATPYPDNEKDFPGKGPARKMGFMQGERDAFFKQRENDQGAVVFVGDSLTGGWKNLAKDFPNLKVANRGVGGDTSRNVLFRLKEDVLDLNPKALVIEIGNNDLTASGRPADMLSNLADMLAQSRKAHPDMPVILCTIPPSANPKAPVKSEDRKAMNEGIKKLAAENKNAHFCDLYTALAKEDGSPIPEYFAEDKLHLSPAGHKKWAQLLMPIFEKLQLK